VVVLRFRTYGIPICSGDILIEAVWLNGEVCSGDISDCVLSGIPMQETKAIRVYPNPACESFSLDLDEPSQVKLTGPDGRVVWNLRIAEPGDDRKFPLSGLPSGIYVVEVRTPQCTRFEKLLVVH
jgi:hypothetical protein